MKKIREYFQSKNFFNYSLLAAYLMLAVLLIIFGEAIK